MLKLKRTKRQERLIRNQKKKRKQEREIGKEEKELDWEPLLLEWEARVSFIQFSYYSSSVHQLLIRAA